MIRRFSLLALAVSLLTATFFLQSAQAQTNQWNQPTIITVSNDVKLNNARRLGINIGAYDQYGAAQYLKNVIPNPGFEAGEFAMIFLADANWNSNRIQVANWQGNWQSHAAGFWDGAELEVLSGNSKGRFLRIQRFAVEQGKQTFYVDGAIQLGQEDAIAVRRTHVPGNHAFRADFATADTSTTRPGSPGKQSLKLTPIWGQDPPGWYVGLDTFARDADHTAGKLRLVDGSWEYELWAKAQYPNTVIEISFFRHFGVEFYSEFVTLGTEWQHIKRRIYIPPGLDALTDNKNLVFVAGIHENPGNGSIWLDDASLMEADHVNPTAFSDNYVNLLRELNPGILRNWGNQLGSSLDNQLAQEWSRQTSGFNPNQPTPRQWHYAITDFLALAQAVGSEPWYVIPPTWSAAELQNFVAYLSAPAGSHPYANLRAAAGYPTPWTSVFKTIHLEYGNEMWGFNAPGDPFQGASLRGGARLGQVASSRFGIMQASPHYKADKLNLIVGGQANNPWQQGQIEANSWSHDAIALAPYFGTLDQFGSDAQRYYPLFASAQQDVANFGRIQQTRNFVNQNGGWQTELAIYEINSHLTHGPSPMHIRNEVVTGMGMGLALPIHMLTYQSELGVNMQAAFTSAQYSQPINGSRDQFVRLWGLLRDVEATQRKRPTWLGLELANTAIRGNMITTQQSGQNPMWWQQPINGISQGIQVPYVQSFAYKGWQNDYALVLFNLDLNQSHTVQLDLPSKPWGNATVGVLSAESIHADNEDFEQVRIQTRQQSLSDNGTMTLPPHSMTVIEWRAP